jgi:hypothetical protein
VTATMPDTTLGPGAAPAPDRWRTARARGVRRSRRGGGDPRPATGAAHRPGRSDHVESPDRTPHVTAPDAGRVQPPNIGARVRTALLGLWAAITGAAPHVLHHVGPLAGTALVAGAGGRLLFGVAGFVATIPMLRRLRRRTGSWRVPGLALAAFAAIYTVSTLLVGPAVGAATSPDTGATPSEQVEVDHHGHDVGGD